MAYKTNKAQQKYSTQQQALGILSFLDTSCMSQEVMKIVKNSSYFFLATSSIDGVPNLNFKGGEKGFVHVLNNKTIIFPDFIGNGILHGINDIMQNSHIAILFIDFVTGIRYKISGAASIIDKTEEISQYLNLKGFDYPPRVIMVDINYVIGNCSKHIDNVRKEIIAFEKNWEAPCGN